MSDNLVSSIGRVEPDLTGFSQGLQAQPQAAPPAAAKSQAAMDSAANSANNANTANTAANTANKANAQAESNAKNTVESKPESLIGNGSDVSLKFQVNPDTNDVTILILNNSSQQVVRTIPAEEMNKMDPGEIVQLFA